jgi:hypothetical protein
VGAGLSGNEMLYNDSPRFATRATEEGPDVRLVTQPDMRHVWQLSAPLVNEARQAIAQARRVTSSTRTSPTDNPAGRTQETSECLVVAWQRPGTHNDDPTATGVSTAHPVRALARMSVTLPLRLTPSSNARCRQFT